MKKLIFFFSISLQVFASNVSIRISNGTNETIILHIEKSKNFGEQGDNIIPLIELKPNESYPKSDLPNLIVQLDRYTVIKCWGTIQNKGGSTSVVEKLITDKNFLFSPNLTLQVSRNESVTTLLDAQKQLTYDPSKFLDRNDISPKPINELFSQYLGSIIAYTIENGQVDIKRKITPIDLKCEDDIHFGTLNNTKSYFIKLDMGQSINGSIPVVSELNLAFKHNTLYEIKFAYDKLGVIGWENHKRVNIDNKLSELPDNTIINIGELTTRFPNLKLNQINRAYVFNGIYSEVNELSKLSNSNVINATNIFTNDGFYSKESSSLDSKVFGSSYLGYWSTMDSDFTGFLQFAKYKFIEYQNTLSQNMKEEDLIKEIDDLRKTNQSIPQLKSKQDIIKFFQSEKIELEKNSSVIDRIKNEKSLINQPKI